MRRARSGWQGFRLELRSTNKHAVIPSFQFGGHSISHFSMHLKITPPCTHHFVANLVDPGSRSRQTILSAKPPLSFMDPQLQHPLVCKSLFIATCHLHQRERRHCNSKISPCPPCHVTPAPDRCQLWHLTTADTSSRASLPLGSSSQMTESNDIIGVMLRRRAEKYEAAI